MISIITATFNRAFTLSNLYKSILKNSKYDKNLEWIIIDDGSKDETEKLVKSWIKENKVKIKYFKQKNAGKMAAINNYISEVSNELVIEVDSDDYLTNNAFNIILSKYNNIKNNDKCYGMLFKKSFIDKKENISLPKKDIIIKLFDLYNKEKFTYDLSIVFKTKFRKKYKYELEKNERFITEARMYNKMDLDFDGLYLIDEYIMICEYMDDGYSKNINKLFINNPYGYFEYFKECFNMDFKGINFKKRLYFIKHYILFGALINKKYNETLINVKKLLNKLIFSILYIPGKMMTKMKMKCKK